MITHKLIKLKKYLFLISILFLFVSIIHLSYIYLYENAKVTPIKGGTISEWLVWNFPSLNPIKPLSWNNEYMVSLLYRSLLKYDLNENKIVWDIASCDISSLINIECYINENAIWSDWSRVTVEDIVKTYDLIKNTESNIILSSLLKDTTIEKKWNILVFKNSKRDVNFLNIFFQPILPKVTIDNLTVDEINWAFPTSDLIYSWDFIISWISLDQSIWISKITLERNPFFNNWNISKLEINIFPDNNSLLRNRQSINIFNDLDNTVWNTINRLWSNKYTLPQFVWVFINQDKITSSDLRAFIINKINSENLVELLWKDNFQVVNNPYITEGSIFRDPSNRNFDAIMNALGYQKKSKFIESVASRINNQNDTIKNEKLEENQEINTEIEINENLSYDEIIKLYQKDLEYSFSPNYIKRYNFITRENFLLEWKVDKNIESVYINEYKLQWFSKWDEKFMYRLSLWFDTIKEGENNYKIYFEKDWKKELVEEVFFYFNTNRNIADKVREEFFINLHKSEVEKLKQKKEEEKISKENKIDEEKKEIKLDSEALALMEKYNKLDEKIYYDKNLIPYTIKLYFLNSQKDLESTAIFIQNSLKEMWITVELTPFDLKDISKIITSKSDYDMILTWINLWYFDFNIFPYFHSSQTSNWYNFSNIKRTSLDLLLEDLKSNIYSEEKTNEIKEKILSILREEQVLKTLYTPKVNLLVDKNLKNTDTVEYLPNTSLRTYILNSTYIREDKVIVFENKNISGFLKFLFKKLYE